MNIKNKNQIDNYLICPSCQGQGRICSLCKKIGVGLWNDGYFFYWHKNINRLSIFQNKIYKTIQLVINFILLIIAIIGIFCFSWKITHVFIPGISIFESWRFILEADLLMLGFWLGLMSGLYLFYRFNRELEQQDKIKEKKYSFQSDLILMPKPASWEDAWKLNKKQKVEISGSFDQKSVSAIEEAYTLAANLKHDHIEPIHLLYALLGYGDIKVVLARLGISPQLAREKILMALSKMPGGRKRFFSINFKKSVLQSYLLAYQVGKHRVGVVDLLLGLVQEDELSSNILYDFEADLEKVRHVVFWVGYQAVVRANYKKMVIASRYKPKGDLDRAMTAMATPFLNQVGKNLTTMAKYGYLFPCIGRDKELDEIFRLMESGQGKDVILVGDHGVGKTTVIEGIAQRMASEDVPDILKDKRLVSLSIASLIGGVTPDVAQARLIQVLNEIIQSRNIVLVVEDIKELTGITVGGEQSLDLAEVFSHALSSRYFLAIATASPKDYTQYIEKNSSLGGIFSPVDIKEVEKDKAILISEIHAGSIESKNQVYFSYAAIEKAVELSERFIHNQYLPQKAIGVLENAAVMVRKAKGRKALVSDQDVAEIISQISNVPVTEVDETETDKLLHLEEKIHEKVIGQEQAVKAVASAVRRARAELRETKKPIANLLFLGPTGVGKTQLAKTLAEVYFGDEKNMIRLDMSEFQDQSGIARFIGTQRGGDGLLTEPVRKNPFSLVLLDEIEKADKNIINIFLQVMEDGRLTDGSGQVIDFTNTIIIATSNAGTGFIQDQIKLGTDIGEITKQLIEDQLKPYYKPEFLNRLDEVIVFKPLEIKEVKQITKLLLKDVADNLEAKGVSLEVTDEAISELAQIGFDPSLGARPLKRVIQEKVRDVLATYVLENRLERRDVVLFDVGGRVEIKKPQD